MSKLNATKAREFSRLEMLSREVVEGFITGLHKSPFHGFSVEFSEHRLYNTGESVRNIDWKLLARTDKLFTKRYEEETNLRCQLVIDSSSSMYYPDKEENKIHFATYCAASILYLMKKQRDAVGLSIFGEDLDEHLKARSTGVQHKLILNYLEQLLEKEVPKKRSSVIPALHQIAEAIPRRSLVVIFSDMFDSTENEEDLFAALQHLRYKKHEVVLFHIMEGKHELELEYGNRPHIFEDLETGEKIKLNPAQYQEEYKKQMSEFKKSVKLKCAQYRIDYIDVDINDGFNPVLTAYLLKRKKMM